MEAREVTRPSRRAASQRLAVLVLYAAGFLQGLTLVCVPALSAALKETLGISDSRYGILFLPQVGCTALAALLGGVLARRLGLKRLLWLSLLANAISQSAVSASPFFAGAAAFAVLLAATSTLGLAFGLSSAPLNTYPLAMFPQRRDAALVALHTALGLGLAAGPLLAASFLGAGAWEHFPLWLAISSGALALLAAAIRFPPTDSIKPPEGSDFSTIFASPLLWLFVAIAILYAFAEGTFSNWAVIYLQEDRGVAPATAAVALSVFWGALAVGRLLVSVLVLKLEAERIWLALPVLMGVPSCWYRWRTLRPAA
ncbi:MAG: MFS transporter [Chromatiales bacterium]